MRAVIFALLACIFATVKSQEHCQDLGEWCDGTVFNRCCGNLRCELTGLFNGKCAVCLGKGRFCWNDSDCCSETCLWYRVCA
ncbi:unnamed protein product [Hymenolepis diminuta]|uniref:UPF0506 domain-containing protein n=1 Tax=Hymenolepis diminuta TaxID=6216 RepID=A0A0R3SCK4_HYMDI|nr:unnamed protein product [Hymenolepis diminuta]VUZ49250.1 unnamed protein product [Hymenolepis diminuta]